MNNNKAITVIDFFAYLINDLLGWFIIIVFDSTGYDCKFQNLKLHWAILLVGLIHIILSIICNTFFFKKERTKYHIKIGNTLFIYNLLMTIVPYLYLAFTLLIVQLITLHIVPPIKPCQNQAAYFVYGA